MAWIMGSAQSVLPMGTRSMVFTTCVSELFRVMPSSTSWCEKPRKCADCSVCAVTIAIAALPSRGFTPGRPAREPHVMEPETSMARRWRFLVLSRVVKARENASSKAATISGMGFHDS